ncbi:MFS transporter [Arthrobacter sp. AL08]|uniref:MFS transporter n=1 Tax=unclassified Arthrobacter TaxID=235627 RepID=UPI00249C3763|nr:MULTISPECIES: MFS transporter [unclassified Arthrobacter]MDI3243195.1 MFS transporter [Arthrobacter sp. AL05]MDI3279205.1 MFS transporter [Arthrobacter sp. AL08]
MSADTFRDTNPARTLQRKVLRVLAIAQILGGIGTGATMSLGAMLITDVSGSSAWSGMAISMGAMGAALLAVPLARLAQAKGRRISLSTGAWIAVAGGATVIVSATITNLLLLLVGMTLMGSGSALNLQARFAATDLATEATRGRDLSLVVWSTTIGAVAGPNLFEPGERLGHVMGMPPFTGGFIIGGIAQLLGAAVYLIGLRPDPLLTVAKAHSAGGASVRRTQRTSVGGFSLLRSSPAAKRAVIGLALSHAVMVALMAMTPVHLTGHGASLNLVGLTISLHVIGMFAFSPALGYLTDRFGGRVVVLTGQATLLAALLLTMLGSDNHLLVSVSLFLLGLGWSASTMAGSAMVSAAAEPIHRPRLQGISDSLMNLAGAAGGAAAGPILALIGFNGLSAALIVLVAVAAIAQMDRR